MKKIAIFFFIVFSIHSFSQETNEDAWLFLKDKPNASDYIENPTRMLSQRAIDRRNKLNINLDITDVPIDENYYNQLKNETTITILGKSKWLNAIHIQGTQTAINGLQTNFNFIQIIEFADKTLNTGSKIIGKKNTVNHQNKFKNTQENLNYGAAENQIKMLKGDYLHQAGLTGENQIIAVIDAGFPNVNTLQAFKRLRDNNQILGGYNFADRNTNFYTRHNHGTNVLSTIGGYLENQFIGTAPDAKFYLFISEIAETETVLEETLWVEAAEKADSLGVDVINTSLGYSTFDNPKHNYTYADMDGKTTFISRGAEIAANKGMLVVNSAGNSGNDSWKFITAPADAPSIITVGAVDVNKNISSFSSFGPSYDGRIKPEILAQGTASSVIHHNDGNIVAYSGTSFSSPIMAGLIACLNDSEVFFVLKSATTKNLNDYLKEAIYKSADRYNNPTDQHGYGIPDFEVAFNYYGSVFSVEENFLNNLKISPNPTSTNFKIEGYVGDLESYKLALYDVLGKEINQFKNIDNNIIDISNLKKGLYILKISKGKTRKTLKIIKQ
ncbi:T9SS type A sorting domain-containing protein [Polaribacter aestuariivivens]|uniref:T9SS type A sorting domain-containing protein n=1 Tax=Polaribacter aestuariivivens TaxID=2304626 RepID=A0A5S3N7P2_9FLAO|nr:S8 family serine peptidase [Polaribacter aestuariivivens]TMM31408.1 T9SS type A sorting domain-containing protein [Polaribacter aestuariivivens]